MQYFLVYARKSSNNSLVTTSYTEQLKPRTNRMLSVQSPNTIATSCAWSFYRPSILLFELTRCYPIPNTHFMRRFCSWLLSNNSIVHILYNHSNHDIQWYILFNEQVRRRSLWKRPLLFTNKSFLDYSLFYLTIFTSKHVLSHQPIRSKQNHVW